MIHDTQKYYCELAIWISQRVCEGKGDLHPHLYPKIIGMSGPQGCGKSTLTQALVKQLSEMNLKAVTLSIDDFYYSRQEQIQLGQKYSSNPLLQQRGYPGTHDIELGEKTLEALKEIDQTRAPVALPAYDKSQHQGQGDRLPQSEWKKVFPPLDIVFLEGWMLGFSEVPEAELPDENFKQINEFLREYKRWDRFLNAFVHLMPEKIAYVTQWRIEAEEKSKAQGKPGMSMEEISAYIEKFIRAYEIYLPQLLKHPPLAENYLRLTLSKNRLPNEMLLSTNVALYDEKNNN